MEWTLNKDNLDSVRKVAKEWESGVVILKPFDGDFVFIAVSRVDFYSPSDNIHHTTVEGKDITQAIIQRLSTADLQGRSSLISYITNLGFEDIWEIPAGERFLWLKLRQRA